MDPALVIAIGAFILAPLVAYFGVARRASGKIGTSEAGELWKESSAIRAWATTRISDLEQRIAYLEDRNEKLFLENGTLTKMVTEQGETIAELRSQIHRLSEENGRLKEDNVALRRRVTELEENGRG